MKAQPAPIGPRNLLGLAKERDEEKQNQVGIDPGLELEIAGEIFRSDLALAFFELERGVEGVIDFFNECDERSDIAIAQSGARIVPLELFDEPARIIDA